MTRRAFPVTVLVIVAVAPPSATAQDLPKPEYFRYLPLEIPRLVRQTAASAELHIYGNRLDPSYRDDAPRDGIDDRRHTVLERLSVRFAPLMVLNTTNIPMDFRAFAQGRDVFRLHIDHWNTIPEGGSLVREETLDLLATRQNPCTTFDGAVANARKDDCRLLELLEAYDPDQPARALERTRAIQPDTDLLEVLYVDFPGWDEGSWKAEFMEPTGGRLPTRYREALSTYVHPFAVAVDQPSGATGYELVLQYWFFYPYNDGGNNHKGDWEHINVVVSPRDAVTRPLSAEEVGAILDGRWIGATGGAELVIKRLDYYFHHKVLTLDFASPNAYLPREAWEAERRARHEERISEDWFWDRVRWRAYRDDAETIVNTHPIVHIGADNKGFDQILAMPGGKNRDSHGSFPFPGLYKDVGPGGATEEISTAFDHRAFFAASADEQAKWLTRWKRGGGVSLAAPDRVQILPDWERIRHLVRLDPAVRADWAWMLLPLRFGYPASVSPFAGIVAHAETGNLAILGPAFSSGWNRAGASAGFGDYQPHKVPRLFPLGLQDTFRNSWGFFNVFAAVTVLPPVDLLWRVVAAPLRLALGRQDPTFYPREHIPYRFFGLTSGVSTQGIPVDFLELAITEDQFDEVFLSILEFQVTRGDTTSLVVGEEEFADRATVPYFQLSFLIGSRFASENMVRHSRSRIGLRLQWNDIAELYELAGAFNLWEYAGSLRHNFATGTVLPYGKLGYGISRYRLEGLTAAGEPLPTPNSRWITKWTWHGGAGIELVTVRNQAAPPAGIDLSFRVDWTAYWHGLGLEIGSLPIETLVLLGRSASDLPRDRRILRQEWRFGVTLSF